MSRRRFAYFEDVRRSKVVAPPDMIGITLVSPGYESLAQEAVRRFHHFTGLNTIVLNAFEEPAFFRKLDIGSDILGPVRAVFYDADLWLVNKVDFRSLDRGEFWGVHELGAYNPGCFVCQDCESHSVPKDGYINTGLMVFDLANEDHKAVFSVARSLAMDAQSGLLGDVRDRTEQSWINIALHGLFLGGLVTPGFLPFSYNYFDYSVEHFGAKRPEIIYGYHAAGVQLIDKEAHLRDNTEEIQWNKSPSLTRPYVA